jgi:hypothetical protein
MRAAEFANAQTRFGMVLSATPFFSASKTGGAAARHVVRELGPHKEVEADAARLSGKGSAALAAIGRASFAFEALGMVLSATPFFSASKTGGAAARHVVRELGPVTLVNLSNLFANSAARIRKSRPTPRG